MFIFLPASAGAGIFGADLQNDLQRMEACGGATRRISIKMVAQGPQAQLAPENRLGKVHADKNMRDIYDFDNEEVTRE